MPGKEETSRDAVALKRSTNQLEVLATRMKSLDESVKSFDIETDDVLKLDVFSETLKTVQVEYEGKLSDLLAIIPADDFAERVEITNSFYELCGEITVRLKRLLHTHKQPESRPGTTEAAARIKLPDIPLPIFRGEFNEWVYFREKFTALINDNASLSDYQKLHYLKASLHGEAATLQASNDTFGSLWVALKERYEIKRVIAERHISDLFNLKPVNRESSTDLRCLLDVVIKNIRVLKTIELPLDALSELFLVHLVSNRLDSETRKAYEMLQKPEQLPKWDEMLTFLNSRCHILESIENSRPQPKQGQFKSSAASSSGSYSKPGHTPYKQPPIKVNNFVADTKPTFTCAVCEKPHFLTQCTEFLKLSPQERVATVKKMNLCFNCLSKSHTIKDCRSGLCRHCQQRHHTLLHLTKTNDDTTKSSPSGSQAHLTSSEMSPESTLLATGHQVLLSTAVVCVLSSYGIPIYARALLDSGSQANFITENLAQSIRAKRQSIHMPVYGINEKSTVITQKITATIQSRVTKYTKELEFLVITKITGNIPNTPVDTTAWKLPNDIHLADPHFATPQPIDMLIGAEIFFEIWTNKQLQLQTGLPTLQESVFGWVAAGKLAKTFESSTSVFSTFCGHVSHSNTELLDQIKKFWELESCQSRPNLTVEEKQVEDHFQTTHHRQPDGRFVVSLPVKSTVHQLGEMYQIARRRFEHLERKLSRNPDLKAEYGKFINEYQQLDHMEPTSSNASLLKPEYPAYFMPHHCVIKPDSTTTKLRVVFDASAKTSTGLSLNDALKVGATVQQELFDIIVRFRKHQYAFTADITKMYRQVRIHDSQHQLQQILWRDDQQKDIIAYSLKTVTYGTASAPFLATRVLNQLADDEESKFPIAAPVARNDFYVDDVLSGSDCIHTAVEMQKQLIELLKSAGFELHKWCSNTPKLLEKIPKTSRAQQVDIAETEAVKTLGLTWLPSTDNLAVCIKSTPKDEIVTKRSILSDIARLYDPLGICGPIILTAKVILQQLWLKQLDWDDTLDEEDHSNWLTFKNQLREIHQIEVPRCVIPFKKCTSITLHGFCDASMTAYGCCIYVRCVSEDNQKSTLLLCSKSRVAPLKTITIPRLELCGAVLLAQLITKIKIAMQINFDDIILWSDSTIVLSWIRSQSNKMKTFVSHRIAEIHDLTNTSSWHHIPTSENPADIISRGLMPSELQQSTLWWSGPKFLLQNQEHWPGKHVVIPEILLPEMKIPVTVLTSHQIEVCPTLTKYSSFHKLQRIIAYVLRFASNCKKPKPARLYQPLQAEDITTSLKCIIRCVQRESFSTELHDIQKGKSVDKKSNLFLLNVFVDSEQIIRVGGRLKHSDQAFDTKHQIVLPKKHHVTTILVRSLHEEHGHVGQQALLSIIRQSYWPVGAKDIVRNVTRRCVKCFRLKPKSVDQLMGDLPKYRVNICHCFTNTGVDYAGPVLLKMNRRTTTKAYLAIFVCLATKAVHIEVVSELSSQAFIAALSRFTARRGHCQSIYSDNATNFVGASNEMSKLYQLIASRTHQEEIINLCSRQRIAFHFIPPKAPHFGGIWEAAVKSTKFHLARIVGSVQLNFEELTTVTTKIEAILNSRPLIAESNDPEDYTAITPGHFLIGRPLVAITEENYTDVQTNRLRRWQLLQKLTQHFWQRWSADYLTTLQKRAKSAGITEVKLNMLVLIKEDNIPPIHWLLGRITTLHPGSDNIVRVVSIRTKNGIFKRPVVKICILPTQETDQD
jgi:hypothetical protein